MQWLHPTYLIALIAVPVAAGLFAWAAWQRRRTLRRFGDVPLITRLSEGISPRRRRWKAAIATLGVFFMALALAGPRFGTKLKEVKREGIDIVIALDVSTSMLAQDVAPSRLERAKNEIKKLLNELRGDRVGLVIFSGDAFIQCPLTTDYNALRLFLDVAEPSLISTPGTNFEAAVRTAVHALKKPGDKPDVQRTRVLLIVSDGENHTGGIEDVLHQARSAGFAVYTAGVGETAGAPIPTTVNGFSTYKRDRDGQIVQTRLEEAALKTLAREGAYFRIGRTSSSLAQIVPALERLERTELSTEQFEEYQEQYQWPLALGLLLLVIERLIPAQRKQATPEPVMT